jgi:hypothetical protein
MVYPVKHPKIWHVNPYTKIPSLAFPPCPPLPEKYKIGVMPKYEKKQSIDQSQSKSKSKSNHLVK